MTIDLTGYKLVFAPSFDSLSLESSSNPGGTWDTTFPYATPGSAAFSGRTLPTNNEAEFYSDPTVGVNPFSVNNGIMTITAAPATSQMLATEAAANGGKTLPYTSGLLTTDTSFAQTYGLYEVTAKLPAGQGLWPAFWFLATSGAWPPEIDLLEEIGNQATTDYMTLHSSTNGTIGTTSQVAMTTGFHTYAVDWEPKTITFYIDGNQVAQEATPADMHQPMYFLMNLAVGGAGSWPGAPNSSTVFPAQMQISSVQAYASPNTIADYNHVGVQTTTPTPTPPPPTQNFPPIANPDSYTGTENHTITGNVMTNDTDPNKLALSVDPGTFATAKGGIFQVNADGTFTYTPATGFTGTDQVFYTLGDTAGLKSTGVVSLTVNAPTSTQSPPVANPDTFTGTQNHPITGNVITNDTDPNGSALTVTAATITTAHGGSVVQNADGTFTYTPAANFTGTDTYNYTLKDAAGLSSTGAVTFTVNAPAPANSPPVANPDSFTGTQNHTITGNVLTNDTDPNGLAMSVDSGTFATAKGGIFQVNADGTFTYTPATGFTGTDQVYYVSSDSTGLKATGLVTLTVGASVPTQSPPVANPDTFTGTENHTITGNVITNDTDPNGLTLSVTAGTITTAHGGSVVQNADGTFTYTPATNFTGTDTYNYTLKDAAGLSSTGTVTLTVNAPAPTQSPPVANPDSFTGTENHTITGNVLTNDTDPNGLALSVASGTFATTHGGVLQMNANGSFTYTPATGFTGTDTVWYTSSDSAGLKASGLVTLTVNAPVATQLPPVATPDVFSGAENHAISGNVMTNDTDPNGFALSVTAATITTAHGSVVENADGTFTYTPAANFTGTDSFSYTLTDTAGLKATGAVTVNVTASSVNPVAQIDTWTGSENGPMFGNMLANNGNGPDTDPNGLPLSVKPATFTTAHGAAVTEASDGMFTYIPKTGFTGTDSFTYTVKDSAGHTSTGTVNVTVEAPSTNHVVTFQHGSNMLYGSSAADTFVFHAADLGSGTDTIRGFNAGQGDKIDISDVLAGHYSSATSAAVTNFVNIVTSGNNSIVEVDQSGHAGASGWTPVVTIFNEPNLNESILLSHGNLIV